MKKNSDIDPDYLPNQQHDEEQNVGRIVTMMILKMISTNVLNSQPMSSKMMLMFLYQAMKLHGDQ